VKYLRVALRFPPELRHPMHQLVNESDAIARDVLVQGTIVGRDADTFLFYVEGDIDVYTAALHSTGRIRDFEVTRIDESGYYVFLTQNRDEIDDATFNAFHRTGVVVVPPIDFRPDGIAHLTVVGEGEKLRQTLAGLPDGVEHTILRIGEYDWRQGIFDPELTDRQLEALSAAVECGYYEMPKDGTVTAVADRLGTSASTASEHLRKAESAVISTFISLREIPGRIS